MDNPDLTRSFARYRQRDPSLFVRGSLRTKDVGRSGHTKMVFGKLRSTGEFQIQSVLVNRKDYDAGVRVVVQNGRPRIVKVA